MKDVEWSIQELSRDVSVERLPPPMRIRQRKVQILQPEECSEQKDEDEGDIDVREKRRGPSPGDGPLFWLRVFQNRPRLVQPLLPTGPASCTIHVALGLPPQWPAMTSTVRT